MAPSSSPTSLGQPGLNTSFREPCNYYQNAEKSQLLLPQVHGFVPCHGCDRRNFAAALVLLCRARFDPTRLQDATILS